MEGVGQSPHFEREVGGSTRRVNSEFSPILRMGEELWVLLESA
jgi:hypothetical protein